MTGVSGLRWGRERHTILHMVIPGGLARVTVALDPVDVDLLDRLAALEGSNRSAELRAMLGELRPMLRQLVESLEGALRVRDEFMAAAGTAALSEFAELVPEAQKIQDAMLGALARLEGAAAVRAAAEPEDPRPSNHGGHTPLTRESGNEEGQQ